MRTLVSELFANGRITTTLTRAKELRRHAEKLITKAKNPTLANRRICARFLASYISKEDGKKDVPKTLIWHNRTIICKT
nr:bL17 family ribosomal protein [Mycoplasmopsis bovis]